MKSLKKFMLMCAIEKRQTHFHKPWSIWIGVPVKKSTLVMSDLVFINWRTGDPAKNSSYDTHLYKLCDEAKIKRFCMHALRHTYATRAIENGMQTKVLQKLLGHASIKTTMDRYVHVTEDSLLKAIRQFENASNAK